VFNLAVVAEGKLLRAVSIVLKEEAGHAVLNQVIVEMVTEGSLLRAVDVAWSMAGGNVVVKLVDAELAPEGMSMWH